MLRAFLFRISKVNISQSLLFILSSLLRLKSNDLWMKIDTPPPFSSFALERGWCAALYHGIRNFFDASLSLSLHHVSLMQITLNEKFNWWRKFVKFSKFFEILLILMFKIENLSLALWIFSFASFNETN